MHGREVERHLRLALEEHVLASLVYPGSSWQGPWSRAVGAFRPEKGLAVLKVEDDGNGFALGDDGSWGCGLRSLRDRAAAMGGSLEITSTPGEAAVVSLR